MVTLNADIGEGFCRFNIGMDSELLKLIRSCNIAYGMHAGEPTVMHNSWIAAVRNNVSISAHTGFNDLWGFGRCAIIMGPNGIRYMVAYQIAALAGMFRSVGTRVSRVKPHGACAGRLCNRRRLGCAGHR